MKQLTLSAGTTQVDVDLGVAGLNIPAMALEIMGFGENAWTSISTPNIQEISSGTYRVTFKPEHLAKQGFVMIALTGPGFSPYVNILFTVVTEGDDDPISGIPVNKDAYLPVIAFSSALPVLGLLPAVFNVAFKKADELIFAPKTVTDIIEPVNEFSVARGVYMIKFLASELNRIGDFTYSVAGAGFDPNIQIQQIAEPIKTTVIFEVRDSSPELLTTNPEVPDISDPTVFIGTSQPINRLSFRFSQFGVGYSGVTFEYFNGTAFTALIVSDGTQNFSQNGDVTWTAPIDQATGGSGAPNQTDYFIKIAATAIVGNAELAKLDTDRLVEGVSLTVLDSSGDVAAQGLTSDLGQFSTSLAPAEYTVVLQKGSQIFNQNNVKVLVREEV